MTDPTDLIGLLPNALRSYGQADEEGIMCIVSRQAVEQAADTLEAQAAEIARLREALEWYATKARACRSRYIDGKDARNALSNDGGSRARAALKGEQQ